MYLLLTVTTISFLAIAIIQPALAVNQTEQAEIEEKASELIKSTESQHWDSEQEPDKPTEEEEEDEEK